MTKLSIILQTLFTVVLLLTVMSVGIIIGINGMKMKAVRADAAQYNSVSGRFEFKSNENCGQ